MMDDRMPLLSAGTGIRQTQSAATYKSTLMTTTTTTATETEIGGKSMVISATSTLEHAVSDVGSDDGGGGEDDVEHHQTTVNQTFIHLLKGYIGPGMLSLPWAVSQLGIPIGCLGIFIMSFWSSYNCWTVVRLKRFIEHQRNLRGGVGVSVAVADAEFKDGGDVSEAGSSVTTMTNITYPDVGEWAYGKTFQAYVSGCICTQQLAICTVFISFIGENVSAILQELPVDLGLWETHAAVTTMAVLCVLPLSFIPSLKGLSPVMAAGTILLLVCLALLGQVMLSVWTHRPDTPAEFQLHTAPLALCAILYSFEGICLILPIESAMKESKHFKPVFVVSMGLVSLILATFSSTCVAAFGNVTSGSVTAFLVEKYGDDGSVRLFLLLANLAVSLSVLFTYPLQLFPAVELLGPSWSRFWGTYQIITPGQEVEDEEKDLTGFEPLPPLPENKEIVDADWENELEEHRVELEAALEEHRYEEDGDREKPQLAEGNDTDGGGKKPPTLDDVETKNEQQKQEGDEVGSLRSFFSSAISFPNQLMPKMILPGDSPQLRGVLVFFTFFVAMIVPNVQALLSLAGALAGSSSALLIPPVMQLAYIQHLEHASQTPAAAVNNGLASPNIGRNLGRLGMTTATTTPTKFFTKWWKDKLICYILFGAGIVFMLIGTYASLADIAAIYLHKKGTNDT